MHQREICLCPRCIWSLGNEDDEARTQAKVAISCTHAKREIAERMSPRVVKRRRKQ